MLSESDGCAAITYQDLSRLDCQNAKLFIAAIMLTTIMTGLFPNELNPVFIHGLTTNFRNMSNKFTDKLPSTILMTAELFNSIHQCKNNDNNLNLVRSGDPHIHNPSNTMYQFCIDKNINIHNALLHLRDGSFCKFMTSAHYEPNLNSGKKCVMSGRKIVFFKMICAIMLPAIKKTESSMCHCFVNWLCQAAPEHVDESCKSITEKSTAIGCQGMKISTEILTNSSANNCVKIASFFKKSTFCIIPGLIDGVLYIYNMFKDNILSLVENKSCITS